MKHKNFKIKILDAMMKTNSANIWQSSEHITHKLDGNVHIRNVKNILEELVSDDVIIKDYVEHYDDEYGIKYCVSIYKIKFENIEKFRNI